MFTALRRKFRSAILLAFTAALFLFCYAYVNLEFCYRLMAQRSFTAMCRKHKQHEYSGSLCEELCIATETFTDFRCPQNEMTTIVFTAAKNGDTYAVKLAKDIKNDLVWYDRSGAAVYPKIDDFHHIVKMHIILSYNITLDDNMIRALVNQEIDRNYPAQMLNFWRLFKDNNYMMSKLFDEEALFPTVFGSCGPYYATETLQPLTPGNRFMQFLSGDWQHKLKFALNVMEYMFRLEEMKPEPLKLCKLKFHLFGITVDRQRLKYQTAEYVRVESQVDKRLSNGARCTSDDDCHWHECMGKCDRETRNCRAVQQNNNMQIFCQHLQQNSGQLFAASVHISSGLRTLLELCANPTLAGGQHAPGRPFAPTMELALRLYNELKRLSKVVPHV